MQTALAVIKFFRQNKTPLCTGQVQTLRCSQYSIKSGGVLTSKNLIRESLLTRACLNNAKIVTCLTINNSPYMYHIRYINKGVEFISRSVSRIYFVKSSQTVTKLIPENHGVQDKRGVCVHSGTFKPTLQPQVKNIDVTGQHQVVVTTTCTVEDCRKENCANVQANIKCPNRIPVENQNTIPTSASFKTEATWNFTCKIPPGKQGVKLGSYTYAGQQKDQFAVREINPVEINPSDFNVNPKSTHYAQETSQHDILIK